MKAKSAHKNRKGKFSSRGDQVNALAKQVFESYGQESGTESSVTQDISFQKGRKQRRRDKKLEKKMRKRMHFKQMPKKNIEVKKTDETLPATEKNVRKRKAILEKHPKEDKKKKELLQDNEKEDKTITALEKKLFLNKRKGKKKLPKSFTDAGLDYILDLVDGRPDGSENDSEDEFFMNAANGKKTEEKDPCDGDDLEDMSEAEMEISDQEEKDDASSCEDDDVISDEEDLDESEILEEEPVKGVKTSIVSDGSKEEPKAVEEQSSLRYIPPALRAKVSHDTDENRRRSKRRIKGLYNRLSDTNLNSICADMEDMYRTNSRALMNQIFSEIVLDQFSAPDLVPESLVMETAMLVTVLSARVAVEVVMHFYEAIALKLHSILTGEGNYSDGKSANNMVQLLSCLYQLKTTDYHVIVDVFHLLLSSFKEKDIELILEILNKVGFQLRKDSPEALRDIIKEVSSKCSDLNVDINDGSRMSYMLSVLMAVKNNNIRKVTGYDPDAVTSRRKRVMALIKTSNESFHLDTLPSISLKDFLDIENSGRWWIVGSSFMGRPMLRGQKPDNETEKAIEQTDISVSKKVVEAARKQRMNTDVRRKIFYAIMTAEDFVDAFEKVMKCGLKGKQLREIANVVVDCCQQEKHFNPYYLHLLKRFCQHDRQFPISLQCTMWDRFKVLHSLKPTQMNNIVELLSHLVLKEAVPLSCLKTIDFAEIDKTTVTFLRSFLCSLAQHAPDEGYLKPIFEHLSSSTKYKIIRQGLHLFLQHFVLADTDYMADKASLRPMFEVMCSCIRTSNKTFL